MKTKTEPKTTTRTRRVLLLATLVIVIMASCLGYELRISQENIRIADMISLRGGQAVVDCIGPKWAKGVLHELSLQMRIVEVRFGTESSPGDLSMLCHLSHLESLRLEEIELQKSDFEMVGQLQQLRHLSLHGTNVTDETVLYLTNLNELRVLSISNTQVTDCSIVHLEGLPSLRTVLVSGSEMTTSGKTRLIAALSANKKE